MAERVRARARQLLGPLAGLIGVVILFAVLEPASFLSVYNFQTIAAQTVIVGFGAIGMTFVIVSGGIDLSVGSVIALSSVVTALALRHDWPIGAAAGAGVMTGLAAGLVNGLLVTRLQVVPFIVTLGSMGIARGLAKYLADEQKIDAPAGWLATVMAKSPTPSWLLVAPGTWFMFALAIIMGFVLTRTVFGVHSYAVKEVERRMADVQKRMAAS